jgi:DNA-binding MarR family transcriptional regulator
MVLDCFHHFSRLSCQSLPPPPKNLDLKAPQWGALSLLLVQDGMTIGTMSQKRGIDPPAATGIITRLEQNGLVERHHDREDRRVVKVYLTTEGKDISHTLVSTVERFEQNLKREFPEGELDRFLADLQQLITTAAEIGSGAVDRFGLSLNAGECSNKT